MRTRVRMQPRRWTNPTLSAIRLASISPDGEPSSLPRPFPKNFNRSSAIALPRLLGSSPSIVTAFEPPAVFRRQGANVSEPYLRTSSPHEDPRMDLHGLHGGRRQPQTRYGGGARSRGDGDRDVRATTTSASWFKSIVTGRRRRSDMRSRKARRCNAALPALTGRDEHGRRGHTQRIPDKRCVERRVSCLQLLLGPLGPCIRGGFRA